MHIYISNELSTTTSLSLYIRDLERKENEYEDIFITLNGEDVIVPKLNSDEYNSGVVVFEGLTPSVPYTAQGYVKYEGEWKEVAGAAFVTPSAVLEEVRPLPSYPFGMQLNMPIKPEVEEYPVRSRSFSLMAAPSSYTPNFYPYIQNQWVWGNGGWYLEADTCMANTLSCIKEIHYYRRTARYKYFTAWWIYGNRASYHHQQEGMFPNEALEKIQSDGVIDTGGILGNNSNLPYFDFYHEGLNIQGARSRVQSSYSSNLSKARENRLSDWTDVGTNSSGIEAVKNSIIENGAAIVWFYLYSEFYRTPSSGIVPAFTQASGNFSHTMAIIGWRVINGKTHWICQNSWQDTWGDGGRCYMPVDNESIYTLYTLQDNPTPPSPITNLRATAITDTSITIAWSISTDVMHYRINYRVKGSNTWIDRGTTGSTSYVMSGLSPTTAYEFKVYAQNNAGNGSPAELIGNSAVTTTGSIGAITYLNVVASSTTKGRISIYWTAVVNATGYRVEVYLGNTTDPLALVSSQNVTVGTDASVDGLLEYRLYTVKVFGTRSGSPNGGFLTQTITTADLTPPTISFVGMSGLSGLHLTWNASDTGIGLRSTNRFRLYVGTKDGGSGTLLASGFTNSFNNTWAQDANGNPLVANAYYWVGVRAYDANDNESTLLSQQIQYKIARPSDWNWYTSKVQGQNINLTADEWNDFCARINQFRIYRGHGEITFTSAVKGQPMTAAQINQARTAINTMAAIPSVVTSGYDTSVSYINNLRTTLNSIP